MDQLALLKDFLKFGDGSLKRKGKEMYNHHLIKPIHFKQDSEVLFSFSVPSATSKKIYNTSLEFTIEDEYEEADGNCDCPYTEGYGNPCKHQYAAAYFLQDHLKKELAKGLKKELNILPLTREAQEQQHTIVLGTHLNRELLTKYYIGNVYSLESQSWTSRNWKPLIDITSKKVSFYFENNTLVSITHLETKKLRVDCNCTQISSTKICVHAVKLLLHIKMTLGESFFCQFDDLTELKKQLLARHGISLDDAISTHVVFGYDYYGEYVIKSLPKNLIKSDNLYEWNNIRNKLNLNGTDTRLKDNTTLEIYDRIALLLTTHPQQQPYIKFEILAIRKKKTGAGDVYKKIAIRNKTSLPLLQAEYANIIPILQPLSYDILETLANSTSVNWDYLSSHIKAAWINKTRKVIQELANTTSPIPLFEQAENKEYKEVFLQTYSPKISFNLHVQGKFVELQAFISIAEHEKIKLTDTQFKKWFILRYQQNLYLLEDDIIDTVELFEKGNLFFPIQDFNKLSVDILSELEKKYEVIYDKSIQSQLEELPIGIPTCRVQMSELGTDYLLLTPEWKYGNNILEFKGPKFVFVENRIQQIERNIEVENEYTEWLRNLHPKFSMTNQNYFYLPFKDALADNWYFDFLQKAQEKEIELIGVEKLKYFNFNTAVPTLNMKVGSGIDWFDVEIEVDYNGLVVPLSELKKAILNQQKYIPLADGSLGVIPPEWILKYSYLFKSGKWKDNKLQVSKFQWTLIDELYNELTDEKIGEELKRKKELLHNIDKQNIYPVPKKVKAVLRDYQQAGFQWLCTLDSLEWGACLADDMGLGKTLQTLTFLAHLNTKERHTHLIICPTSLIYNWESEILKFCKHLKYHIHYGADRDKDFSKFSKFDIILTSYGMLRSDIKEFASTEFKYVILDESHSIKNHQSLVAKSVSVLKCKNRIALSGTPLQNNTMDIYSQMNFLNPGMLGSLESFRTEFATPIDKHGEKDKIEMLRKILFPFMLRRTKEQVAKDLPDKTETILWCEMETEQRKIYNSFKDYYRKMVLGKIDEIGMEKSGFYILEGLLKLRQICDSPAILNEEEQYPNESVKIEELIRELEENTGEHKALVFSQFVTMLSLIRMELEKREIPYVYLDGSTPAKERKNVVASFQENADYRVMLISLKAGGVGLNLTSADYVYLVDPWWNPATEQQAIDRTHRIGQTQKVFAYKMICKDSIEEKILHLQDKKKSLSADIISGESSFVKKLTRDDIQFLFS